jgi:hypothetical protein
MEQKISRMVNASSRKRGRDNSTNSEEDGQGEYQVEAIIDKRVRGKKTEYLLKWKGYSHEDNTVSYKICFALFEVKIVNRLDFSGFNI